MIDVTRAFDARKAEFAAELLRHQTQIFGFIYSLVRNFDDADDLFQQTGLVLWRKYEQFDHSRSFVAWACGVARLEASNFLRARSRERRRFSDELNDLLIDAHAALEHEDLEEWRDALAECMKKLTQHDQELLQACYGASVRISEVARRWERSTQSIHNSLRRIRRAMYGCVHRRLARGAIA
jgi:RNA polymerase sigma-70 factor (ECF subfamily)